MAQTSRGESARARSSVPLNSSAISTSTFASSEPLQRSSMAGSYHFQSQCAAEVKKHDKPIGQAHQQSRQSSSASAQSIESSVKSDGFSAVVASTNDTDIELSRSSEFDGDRKGQGKNENKYSTSLQKDVQALDVDLRKFEETSNSETEGLDFDRRPYVSSDDDGPTDFTINLEHWMRGHGVYPRDDAIGQKKSLQHHDVDRGNHQHKTKNSIDQLSPTQSDIDGQSLIESGDHYSPSMEKQDSPEKMAEKQQPRPFDDNIHLSQPHLDQNLSKLQAEIKLMRVQDHLRTIQVTDKQRENDRLQEKNDALVQRILSRVEDHQVKKRGHTSEGMDEIRIAVKNLRVDMNALLRRSSKQQQPLLRMPIVTRTKKRESRHSSNGRKRIAKFDLETLKSLAISKFLTMETAINLQSEDIRSMGEDFQDMHIAIDALRSLFEEKNKHNQDTAERRSMEMPAQHGSDNDRTAVFRAQGPVSALQNTVDFDAVNESLQMVKNEQDQKRYLRQLETRLEGAHMHVESLQSQLSTAHGQESEESKQESVDKDNQIALLNAQIEELRVQQNETQNVKRQCDSQRDEISSKYEKMLSDQQTEINALHDQNKQLQSKMAEAETRALCEVNLRRAQEVSEEKMRQKCNDLESQLATLNAQDSEGQALDEALYEIMTLTEQRDEYQIKNASSQAQCNAQSQQIKELEAKLCAMKDNLISHEDSGNYARNEAYTRMTLAMAELANERDEAIKSLEGMHRNAEAEKASHSETARRLQTLKTELDATKAALNTTTNPRSRSDRDSAPRLQSSDHYFRHDDPAQSQRVQQEMNLLAQKLASRMPRSYLEQSTNNQRTDPQKPDQTDVQEWLARIDAFCDDRDQMANALMRAWGREELGPAQKGERQVFQYRYLRGRF